jgi:ATP-binding cassette subfamily F protein 3
MSFDAPHIMLLDEPTNHLDIDAREALMQALNNYKGAVILVSHDPHLVECVADRLWLVANGTVKPYEDDLDAYRNLIVRQRKQEREEAKQASRSGSAKKSNKAASSATEAEKLESKIRDLNVQRETLENEIAVCCTTDDVHQLTKLNHSYAQLQKDIQHAEASLESLIAAL